MRYREALKIGKRAEGTIKCTFATIYDAAGHGLFSMQRVHQNRVVNWKGEYNDNNSWNDAIIIPTGDNVYFSDSRNGSGLNANMDGELKGGVTFDLPFVVADTISNERLVPVKLTETAIEVIKQACENVKITKFIVEKVWDAPKPNTPGGSAAVGSRTIVKETYYLSPSEKNAWLYERGTAYYHYEIRTEAAISPKYIELSEILETRGTVYIKPDAFEWYALDIENAIVTETDEDGNEIDINLGDQLAEAERQLNIAKAALIAAGAASLA